MRSALHGQRPCPREKRQGRTIVRPAAFRGTAGRGLGAGQGGEAGFGEVDAAFLDGGAEVAAFLEPALDDLLRERVLQVFLNRPPERPRAVRGLVALLQDPLPRLVVHVELDPLLQKLSVEVRNEDVDDVLQVILRQRVEDDNPSTRFRNSGLNVCLSSERIEASIFL